MIGRHDESAYLGGLVGLERLVHLRLLVVDIGLELLEPGLQALDGIRHGVLWAVEESRWGELWKD